MDYEKLSSLREAVLEELLEELHGLPRSIELYSLAEMRVQSVLMSFPAPVVEEQIRDQTTIKKTDRELQTP